VADGSKAVDVLENQWKTSVHDTEALIYRMAVAKVPLRGSSSPAHSINYRRSGARLQCSFAVLNLERGPDVDSASDYRCISDDDV
jgi:hypothetical protein